MSEALLDVASRARGLLATGERLRILPSGTIVRAAVWDALPLAARRRREGAMRRDVLREREAVSQREAAKRAAKVAARVEALPPMPRKLRPKPRARQGNSHFVGPGKFYADWNEFDADLDKWEAERAARKELMAERHEAQQRVFRAKHPRLVTR